MGYCKGDNPLRYSLNLNKKCEYSSSSECSNSSFDADHNQTSLVLPNSVGEGGREGRSKCNPMRGWQTHIGM